MKRARRTAAALDELGFPAYVRLAAVLEAGARITDQRVDGFHLVMVAGVVPLWVPVAKLAAVVFADWPAARAEAA